MLTEGCLLFASCDLSFAITEGLGKMRNVDDVGAVEVGDGLGDFDDFEVGTSGEI